MKVLKIGFSALCFSQVLLAQSKPCAKLALRIGEVEVVPAQKELSIGSTLGSGTSIRTGKDSFVKLMLVDRSLIDIGPETSFKLVQCQSSSGQIEIDLELELGGIRANVVPTSKKRKLELKTPTSLLGVRGTEFFVSWMKNSSGQIFEQVGVSRGEVLVAKLFEPRISPTVLRTGTEVRSTGKEGGPLESRVDQFSAAEQRRFEQKTKLEGEKAFESIKQELRGEKKNVSREEEVLQNVIDTSEKNRRLASKDAPEQAKKRDREKKSDRQDKLPDFVPGSEGVRSGTNAVNTNQSPPNFQDYVAVRVLWGVKKK